MIEKQGFTEPTEVQEKTIPLCIGGKDVIAMSATGSGKTLAFASGFIQTAERGRGIQALIITPTRELADQVAKAIRSFSSHKQLNVVEVIGGVAFGPQAQRVRGADIIVATPGRLIDHISQRTVDLSKVKVFVIDEADRMFDMGFIRDVERIFYGLPQDRQTLLFSATITDDVMRLSKRHMREPISVVATSFVDPSKLKQVFYFVEDDLKFSLLVHLIKTEQSGLVMVFCNTRRNVDRVYRNLELNGIESQAIHGGFNQSKRSRVMDDFHSSRVRVLVCTDVAARGLDIKGVKHIYNYDIPAVPNHYIHRIGRTARAGEEGKAISIVSREDSDNFRHVLRTDDFTIEELKVPSIRAIPMQRGRRQNTPQGQGFRPQGGRRGGGRPRQGGGGRPQQGGGRSRPRSTERRAPRQGYYRR
jgi:ATP-dependent RNA helicase DeaD